MRNPPKEDLDSLYLNTEVNTHAIAYSGEYIPVPTRRASTKVNDIMYHLTSAGFHKLLYPDWKIDTLSLRKQVSTIFNLKDRWWFDAHQNQDQKLFFSAFESLYNKFTKWGFTNFKNHDFRNLQLDLTYSKKYILTKFKGNADNFSYRH
jgi:hypothetical protein